MTLLTLTWLHALCTIGMTGLVWFVQLVHYPLFALLDDASLRPYAREHQRRTTWLVGPLMVGEALSACALLVALRGAPGQWPAVAGLALLVVIWLATAVWQVPAHGRLARQPDADTVRWLVRSNWVRTLAWTVRAAIALALLRVVP